MNNQYEELCKTAITAVFTNTISVNECYGKKTIEECAEKAKNIAKHGYHTLIEHAETHVLTEKGNNRKIELKFISQTGYSFYVDAKHAETTSNITDTVLGDIKRGRNLHVLLYIVCFGNGYTNNVINELREECNKNVLIFKGKDELTEQLLKDKKQIERYYNLLK